MTTVNDTLRQLRARLAPSVGDGEARAMAYIIVEDMMGYNATQMIVNSDRQLEDATVRRMLAVAERVIAGEPLQYVLGAARLRGREFRVTPSVLIPRPETGQLIDLIVDENRRRRDCRVLDIGTGSGCIAISLALDLPFAEVDAIDISPQAIDVAAANAKALKAAVKTWVIDVYQLGRSRLAAKEYDIIVSNPPYVLESERASMDRRVTDHEPAQALFVDDARPIAIYEAIADAGQRQLSRGGRLYLEINPLCAEALRRMLTARGYDDVGFVRDYRGVYRFVVATKH